MNRSQIRKRIAAVTIAAILLPLAASPLVSPVQAESAEVNTSNPYYTKVSAPVIQPSWSFIPATLKDPSAKQSITALAENGIVFALQSNYKLIALKAATGKKSWEYGSALAPMFTYSNGAIYGLTQKGALYAVKENGSKLWSADISLPNASSIQVIGSTVYVTQGIYLTAVDAASGKIKWKVNENTGYYGSDLLTAADGVILRTYLAESVMTLPSLVAYDAQTGKKLWEQYRQSQPLVIKDGLLYSVKSLEMLDDDPVNRKIAISVINLKTGDIKGERQYGWTANSNDDAVNAREAGGSAYMENDNLYIFRGSTLARYNFWDYAAGGKPAQVWQQPVYATEAPLNKVLQQRMLYFDYSSQTLAALKLANGQVIRLSQGENPAVQLDIFGGTIYTGQSDGLFHAYDFLSYKPLFTVNTGSRDFMSTLKTGNMLIIRSGGKLLGIKLPAAVK